MRNWAGASDVLHGRTLRDRWLAILTTISLCLWLLAAVSPQASADAAGAEFRSSGFRRITNQVDAGVAPERSTSRGLPAALARPGYIDKESIAWKAYKSEVDTKSRRAYYNIAATPTAVWLIDSEGGISRLRTALKRSKQSRTVPQFVLYSVPGRDCGGLAAGGSSSLSSYQAWIDKVVRLVHDRAVIVIMEPDAISFCNNDPDVRALRSAAMTYAAKALSVGAPNAVTYIHAGSAELPLSYAVSALKDTGISYTRGFVLNVASHGLTSTEERYGTRLVRKLKKAGVANRRYVVDTSRNGVPVSNNPGAPYYSCNNLSAALGTRPTVDTAGRYEDAYLWIKPPGESDGQCRSGEPSGWFPALARSLVANAREADTLKYLNLPR